MSKQKKNNFLPKDMLTRLDEQIEFFTARRHFSYVGFFEECKKEIEQLRHDLSRAVERETEHLAEAEQLQARVRELEAENAELRKDAERYRFARDNIQEDYDLPGSYFLCDEGGQFWDNTIDAAMAATDDEGEA